MKLLKRPKSDSVSGATPPYSMATDSSSARTRRTSSYSLQAFAAASLAATFTISTGLADPSNRKITVTKEVLLMQGTTGIALHSIVKTPDGGFVIVGSIGNGWATRVTAAGEVIWNYHDSGKSPSDHYGQNPFKGALILPDNSTLLCGSKGSAAAGDDMTGYLVHLDPAGNVLSRSSLYPNGDKAYGMSSINRCFPWKDGFALLGGASSHGAGAGWLMKLNSQGTKEWEKIGPNLTAGEGIETADHDLALLSPGATLNTVILRRISTEGEMSAQRTIEQTGFHFIRTVEPSTNVYAAIYRLSSSSLSTSVAAFDSNLRDLAPESPIKTILFDHGRAFMFPDQSLAVFGYVDLRDHSSTAAVAYVDSRFNEKSSYHFKPEHESIWVVDAVALNSEGDFAVIRNSVPLDEKHVGVVLSWVSIK